MPKSYSDYIKTGQMDQLTAIKHNTCRRLAREAVKKTLTEHASHDLPADASAFGMLDVIAVKFVEWYGPAEAAEIFRHYANVSERQAPVKGPANG